MSVIEHNAAVAAQGAQADDGFDGFDGADEMPTLVRIGNKGFNPGAIAFWHASYYQGRPHVELGFGPEYTLSFDGYEAQAVILFLNRLGVDLIP